MCNKEKMMYILADIYAEKAESIYTQIEKLILKYKDINQEEERWVDENDVMVITYADTIVSDDESGIKNLSKLFAKSHMIPGTGSQMIWVSQKPALRRSTL